MRRWSLALAMVVALLVLATPAAVADSTCSETYDLGGATRACHYSGSEAAALVAGSGPNGDGHTYTVRPQCGQDDTGGIVCHGAAECTADDGQPGTLMDLYRDGEIYGSTCLSDSQADNLGVITPGRVLREFKALTWPASPLSIQPPGLKTAVNFPTYYYTDNTRPHTQTVQIIGQSVQIEATPTSYT